MMLVEHFARAALLMPPCCLTLQMRFASAMIEGDAENAQ
jgi:hypothetical protein